MRTGFDETDCAATRHHRSKLEKTTADNEISEVHRASISAAVNDGEKEGGHKMKCDRRPAASVGEMRRL